MKFVMMVIKLPMTDVMNVNIPVSRSVLVVSRESVKPAILLAGNSINIISVSQNVVMG